MPLYEYQCDACGNRFEKIVQFSDPPLETCPSCGGKVQKLFSSPAIQFKGSGWYITDYAKKNSSDGGAGKSSSGTDSKEKPAAADSATKSDAPAATPSTPAKE